MSSQYEVLGLEPGADIIEVKRAYKDLARAYKLSIKRDLCDMAKQNLIKLNKAYMDIVRADEITYTDVRNSDICEAKENITDMKAVDAVRGYLKNKKYSLAQSVLSQIKNHDGRWHYLKAHTEYGLGNNVAALSHAKQAYSLSPSTSEYADLVLKMSRRYDNYRDQRYRGGGICGDDCCDCCCKLYCADSCCECMGGDLCSCF